MKGQPEGPALRPPGACGAFRFRTVPDPPDRVRYNKSMDFINSTCHRCGIDFSYERAERKNTGGGKRINCDDCGYSGNWTHPIRAKIRAIKESSRCADCGYNENWVALQFDHLPGHEKLFNIANPKKWIWEEVQAEIAKCEVVCANCHAIRTWERRAAETEVVPNL